MRNTFVDTILEACAVRDDVFVVSGDAGLGVFDSYKEEHPHRFLNLGVAEQNAIGFSAGLAMCEYKVYVYNIIPFVLYRCYEQVRNDICYQKLPVVLVGIGSGVTYSPQGMTHYSVEDIGIARTLPGLTVLSPADPIEARYAAEYSLAATEPVYVRLAKRGEPEIHHGGELDITQPLIVADGADVAIVFHGSISVEALSARELLGREDIVPRLISVPMVQPLDWDAVQEVLTGIRHVFVVEEHFVNTGLGSILAAHRALHDAPWSLHLAGIEYRAIHEIRDQNGMRDMFGLSAAKLAERVARVVTSGSG